jgi:60 kDa SS-A/Ro ribonucleoprotein
MANKNVFRSWLGKLIPATDTVNEERAPAYAMSPKQALAQYAATGCMNATFYATGEAQLAAVTKLCETLEPEFVARTALYCRERGFMKDMPALLCAILATKAPELLGRIFDRAIDDGKMVRNFVQIIRSGAVGRKSLGSAPKRLVEYWLASRDDEALFRASVGNDPSLADVIRMVHPRPANPARSALYAYLLGREHDAAVLPELVRRFEGWKATKEGEAPEVPFQMLTALELGAVEWATIARRAGWQMTRMNLNTFLRHGVFAEAGMPERIAARLRDPEAIGRARVFPYQLLAAYRSADAGLPEVVRSALGEAMEEALRNVPEIDGRVYVLPDVSGSMASPVTGVRKGATTAVRCIDVAALVAAAVLRKNPEARVIPFAEGFKRIDLDARAPVLANADRLAALGGGGTNCSAPLALLNREKAQGDLVIYVSDNQSWVDAGAGRGTATMQEWSTFRARNPAARLACIDIQPYATTQAAEQADVLNVGGFSDEVFTVIAAFARGGLGADRWVGVIDAVNL